jgi:hypothetical protein
MAEQNPYQAPQSNVDPNAGRAAPPPQKRPVYLTIALLVAMGARFMGATEQFKALDAGLRFVPLVNLTFLLLIMYSLVLLWELRRRGLVLFCVCAVLSQSVAAIYGNAMWSDPKRFVLSLVSLAVVLVPTALSWKRMTWG